MLAMDALRYSLNIPSVQMQGLAGGPEVTATFAESLGIASYDYIMAQDPGLSLGLGTVPVNLTNFTQGYSAFAQQGTLHPATAIIEIRDRDGEVVYTREANGPETTNPMTPGEAYLTHWIIEGNTNPATNLLWGPRAQLFDPDGQRRPAGFKTGTTDDFKDVSGMGYIPGSLTVGVWMGNNNQEPMSNAPGPGPVLGRRTAVPVARLHGSRDQRAVGLERPRRRFRTIPFPMPGRRDHDQRLPLQRHDPRRLRPDDPGARSWTGRRRPGDNVHHADQWHPGGCFDIVQYVQQAGRPSLLGQRRRGVGGQGQQRPSRAARGASTRSRRCTATRGFGGPFCGQVKATPTPSPAPAIRRRLLVAAAVLPEPVTGGQRPRWPAPGRRWTPASWCPPSPSRSSPAAPRTCCAWPGAGTERPPRTRGPVRPDPHPGWWGGGTPVGAVPGSGQARRPVRRQVPDHRLRPVERRELGPDRCRHPDPVRAAVADRPHRRRPAVGPRPQPRRGEPAPAVRRPRPEAGVVPRHGGRGAPEPGLHRGPRPGAGPDPGRRPRVQDGLPPVHRPPPRARRGPHRRRAPRAAGRCEPVRDPRAGRRGAGHPLRREAARTRPPTWSAWGCMRSAGRSSARCCPSSGWTSGATSCRTWSSRATRSTATSTRATGRTSGRWTPTGRRAWTSSPTSRRWTCTRPAG